MGETVADVHWALHGQGTTGYTPRVRLHFGDENIDETHDMAVATVRSLIGDRAASQRLSFAATFGAWLNANGSAAAKAEGVAFEAAAWAGS